MIPNNNQNSQHKVTRTMYVALVCMASITTSNISAMGLLGSAKALFTAIGLISKAKQTYHTLVGKNEDEDAKIASSHKYPINLLQCATPIPPSWGTPKGIGYNKREEIIVASYRAYTNPLLFSYLDKLKSKITSWLTNSLDYEILVGNPTQETIEASGGILTGEKHKHLPPQLHICGPGAAVQCALKSKNGAETSFVTLEKEGDTLNEVNVSTLEEKVRYEALRIAGVNSSYPSSSWSTCWDGSNFECLPENNTLKTYLSAHGFGEDYHDTLQDNLPDKTIETRVYHTDCDTNEQSARQALEEHLKDFGPDPAYSARLVNHKKSVTLTAQKEGLITPVIIEIQFPKHITQDTIYAPAKARHAVLCHYSPDGFSHNTTPGQVANCKSFAINTELLSNKALPSGSRKLIQQCIDEQSTRPLQKALDQTNTQSPAYTVYEKLIANLKFFYPDMDGARAQAQHKLFIQRIFGASLGLGAIALCMLARLWTQKK